MEQEDRTRPSWVFDYAWWVVLGGAALAIGIGVIGLTWAPKWSLFEPELAGLNAVERTNTLNARREAVADGAIRLATGIGALTVGLLAVARLQLSNAERHDALKRDDEHRRANAEQERLALDANRTDRYTQAINQLASQDDVALGGIYALEQLGYDYPAGGSDDRVDGRRMITEVLSAYIRQHTRGREQTIDHAELGLIDAVAALTEPVQAALSVLGRTSWHPPDLHGANLEGANLRNADLHNGDFTRANLTGVDLTAAVLSGADLRSARLNQANLNSANLEGANLYEAQMPGAFLPGAILTNAGLGGVDLSGSNLTGVNLEGANLSRANLSRCRLAGAHLGGAIFTWANLREIDASSGESYKPGVGTTRRATDFTGAKLSGADLFSANLEDANLQEVDASPFGWVRSAVSGSDATNFSGANLRGANLTNANLSDAAFGGADLRDANFEGAIGYPF